MSRKNEEIYKSIEPSDDDSIVGLSGDLSTLLFSIRMQVQ